MNCVSCGAVLPANSSVCEYCNARNPIDLKGVIGFSIKHQETDRHCPSCQTPLQLLDLATKPPICIDRCLNCGGLFFPPGGMAFLLEQTVGPVYAVQRDLLENLHKEFYRMEKIVYRKCPVCSQMMRRHAFGFRSGVIVDSCANHGDWLDSGEFLHLAEWKKAGGLLMDQ